MSEFDFHMEHAAARIAAGEFDHAMRTYGEIAASGDLLGKLEALCKMVELELELGKLSAAETRLGDMFLLLAERRAPPESAAIHQAHVEWLRTKLAFETGDFHRAVQQLPRVRKNLLRLADHGKHSVKWLHTDVAVESANHATDRGEFIDAQKHLDEASTICGSEPKLHLSSLDVSLARIILNLSRLRPGDGQSLREHVLALEQARETAERARSSKHAILMSTLHLQLQLTHPNPVPEVERVVTIAKRFSNPRLVSFVSLMLADYLMQGRHWRMAGGLLQGSFHQRTFLWGLAMHTRGEYLLKLGDPFTAHDYQKLAVDGAQHVGNSRLYGSALRGLAMSAHLSGSKQEAADYIEVAVPIAEQYGTIGSCLKVNQCAAIITGKTKYVRAAEKLQLAVTGTPNFLPA